MSGHVRMDKDLKEDPRVLKLTDAVLDDWVARGLPSALRESFVRDAHNAVTGALFALWRHADTYLVTGDVTRLTVTQLASVTGLSVTVVTQLPPEWLKCRDDGTVELPDYTIKNALITKDIRKEQNKIRQQRYRDKQRNARNALLSHESNARNSPSRGGAHARAHALPLPSQSEDPQPPPSGGAITQSVTNGSPRANGTNPRALAKRAAEDAAWAPLLERAEASGFRAPDAHDSLGTYETSLKLHERDHPAADKTTRAGAGRSS